MKCPSRAQERAGAQKACLPGFVSSQKLSLSSLPVKGSPTASLAITKFPVPRYLIVYTGSDEGMLFHAIDR